MWGIVNQSTDNTGLIKAGFSTIDSRLDADTLANMILMKCGDVFTRYNDTKTYISFARVWWKSRVKQIAHLLDALLTDYDPKEEFNTYAKKKYDSDIGADYSRKFTDENNTTNTHTDDTTNEETVSADNEEFYQPREKTISHNEGGYGITTTDESETKDRTDRNQDDTTITERHGHNKSIQDLLLTEYQLTGYNVYDIIVNWYADDFCINVW